MNTDTPAPANGFWLAFSLDHKEDEAAASFRQRFGQPPQFIVESRGLLRVGPVPEGQEPKIA